jgi:hypothetical protein
MKTEFTTDELIKIAKVDAKTFPAWVRKGWVPPLEAGGGRGHQNKFDEFCVVWSVVLKEIFLIWPKVSCPVYLFEDWLKPLDQEPTRWKDCMLSDGRTILHYLRRGYPFGEAPPEMAVTLITGFVGLPGITKPNRRFAEIRIRPEERLSNFMRNWLHQRSPYTTTGTGDKIKTVRCVAVINLSQIFSYVAFMSKRL